LHSAGYQFFAWLSETERRRFVSIRNEPPAFFSSLFVDRWEARRADTRIHGTTKRQVAAMFDEEKPALLPLPLEPFRFYQFGERTVNLDGCVEVDAAYYSARPGWIGRHVKVQWDQRTVRVLQWGQMRARPVATNRRSTALPRHPSRRGWP
jgi:hypothetical protein